MSKVKVRNYLDYENARNRTHRQLYSEMLREALGHPDEEVVVAHHITFDNQHIADENEPIELSSADTFIFCHDFARVLWPTTYLDVLAQLAREPVETRDVLLRKHFDARPLGIVQKAA